MAPPTVKRWAINAFILFFTYSVALLAIPPRGRELSSTLIGPVRPLVRALGMWHKNRLFWDPPRLIGYLDFYVSFDDGMNERWTYPRSVMMIGDPPGSFNNALNNYVFWDYQENARATLPCLARYVAEQNESAVRHPIEVRIVEELADIPAPDEAAGKPSPQRQVTLCTYNVRSGQTDVLEKPQLRPSRENAPDRPAR